MHTRRLLVLAVTDGGIRYNFTFRSGMFIHVYGAQACVCYSVVSVYDTVTVQSVLCKHVRRVYNPHFSRLY